MGAAGRARAVEEFSLEVSSKRLADVFRRTTLSR
jgi:glycosyltransferase involved in cell wall biosynthesis